MKARLAVGVLVVLAVSALGAIGGATSAFAADGCWRVHVGEPSSWLEGKCATKKVGEGGFAKGEVVSLHGDLVCVKVLPTEPSSYEDAKCEHKRAGEGLYVLAAVLPQFTVETKFTGTSGKGKLTLSGSEIKCEEGTSEGSPTSKLLGKFTIDFKKCTIGGKECHSEGDAEGIELVAGEYHLVRLGLGLAGMWLLVNPVKIVCKFLSTKIELKGNVLGGITPINTKAAKFEIAINAMEGKQAFTQFENDELLTENAKLEGSVNGGAFKEATEESAENKITTEKETEIESS